MMEVYVFHEQRNDGGAARIRRVLLARHVLIAPITSIHPTTTPSTLTDPYFCLKVACCYDCGLLLGECAGHLKRDLVVIYVAASQTVLHITVN